MKIHHVLAYIVIFLVEILRIANRQAFNPLIPWDVHLYLSMVDLSWFIMTWHFFLSMNKPFDKIFPIATHTIPRILAQTTLLALFIYLFDREVAIPVMNYIASPHQVFSAETANIGSTFFFTTVLSAIYFSTSVWELLIHTQVRSERLLKEKAIQDQDHVLMRFTDLKNKLDPHFLFNSITVATELVYDDPEKTEQFLLQLSKVYRYVVQHYDQSLVALKIEVEFVQDYLQLLRTRFGEGFHYELDHSLESVEDMYVIPLTLQVLLENIIKHNIVSQRYPVKVRIWATDTTLCIENNLNPKKGTWLSEGLGLENLTRQYLYYTETPLEIVKTDKAFCVKIPLFDPTVLELNAA